MRPAGILIFFWLVLVAWSVQAETIVVVAPERSDLTDEFTQALQQIRSQDSVQFRTLDDPSPVPAPSTLVTLGKAALDWGVSFGQQPLIGTYVSTSGLQSLGIESLPPRVRILLANPKPSRQVALARELIPRLNKLGVVHTSISQPQLNEWAAAATDLGLQLVPVLVSEQTNLNRRLTETLDTSDVLMAPDDPSIYNADNLKTILLTSYARNKVMIGPSAPFIAAGSLSTTYSSPVDTARSVQYLLEQPESSGQISYPHYFSVLSNQQVARSLGFPPPDDAALAAKLTDLKASQ